ncbi:MAG: YcgJ family protein, partial [Plesiomonas sp.]
VAKFCATENGISPQHSLHYLSDVVDKDSMFNLLSDISISNQSSSALDSFPTNYIRTRYIQFSNGVICNLKNKSCEPLSDNASYIEFNLFSIGH